MPFRIKESLDNSSGSLRNSKASVISVDASEGNLEKAKIPNISHYHYFKPESTGLRAWEFQGTGTGKHIPYQPLNSHPSSDVLVPFQDAESSKKSDTLMKTKSRKSTAKLFCHDRECVEVISTGKELNAHLNIGNIATLRRLTTDTLLMTKLGFFLQKKLKEASFSQSCLKESPRNTKKATGRKNTKIPKGKGESDTCRFEEKGNKMGWALRERRKKVKFGKSLLEFLLDVYNEGERSGKKKDPASVVELMKLATKDTMKPFTPQEYLRKEQISAYFSRLTIQRRKGKGMESVSDQDKDGFEEGSNDEKHACLDEESDENENEDSESEDNDEFGNTDESDDDGDESDSDMDEDEDLASAIEEDLKDRERKNELNTSNDVLSSLKSSSENAVESNGSLEVVPICGDGNCLFHAIASGITTTLISCERNEGGYPVDKVHAAMEAKFSK